jgi:hypothetical protein
VLWKELIAFSEFIGTEPKRENNHVFSAITSRIRSDSRRVERSFWLSQVAECFMKKTESRLRYEEAKAN